MGDELYEILIKVKKHMSLENEIDALRYCVRRMGDSLNVKPFLEPKDAIGAVEIPVFNKGVQVNAPTIKRNPFDQTPEFEEQAIIRD